MRLGRWILACAASALVMTGAAAKAGAETSGTGKDFSFLDDIHGAKALGWVRAQNHHTTSTLEKDKRYAGFYKSTLAVLQAPDRLALPSLLGGDIWNFWQDAQHPHGIWRETTQSSYLAKNPKWETRLDVDALAAKEHMNWVFKEANCLAPDDEHCLIVLSNGGEDADTLREFNTKTGQFVPNGFQFSRSKQTAAWVDQNTVLLTRDWDGKGETLTPSGYPFVVKKMVRGAAPGQEVEVYRGEKSDMMVAPIVLTDGDGHKLVLIQRSVTFFENHYAVVEGDKLRWLPLPAKTELHGLLKGRLVLSVEEDWHPQGLPVVPAGSLVSVDPAAPDQSVEVIFTPGPSQSIDEVGVTKNTVLVSLFDNVRGRAMRFTEMQRGRPWDGDALDLPDMTSIHIVDTDHASDTAYLSVEGYLEPQQLWMVEKDAAPRKIKSAPARFKTANLKTEQFWAQSPDGTRVPYFVVHRRNMKLDGQNPTLLTAYGGFQVSYTPTYAPEIGKLWLERGGVYVVANIRGGGEFGPAWHEAGRKSGRQNVYDDFAAVGQDLVTRKITTPRHLGIRGRSNGGLLAGVQMVQHPHMWNAVIIGVPLLDMEHFETMSAGASWADEYGSMSVPEEAKFLKRISPVHHLKAEVTYPTPFIFTATSDDRVGPVHARRFAARLESMGKPFYYYEDIEGGHSGTVNASEVAHERALEAVYLFHRLMDAH
ncbi:MAG: prolyl oligopeptidase family serine peptidase [Acetobacter indonesiensis]|jgi:prolyl oligopeptidase|nr:prolyl oligopeptidase family serine peptidase [Acetobacter indonesiensis]MCI1545747.1 prolyl oligopeptidase family serine peptidase [Acetobacter indonesiensis]MCI1765379.1 prolyl oligopeptidase family serine peptidase [Acetobacter indonesiensis]